MNRWTAEEIEYLVETWGTVSIPTLAEKLGRTEGAVRQKAQKLGRSAFLENGDYITFNKFLKIYSSGCSCSYKNISWVKRRKFPIKKKRVINNSFSVVCLDDWWKWAYDNMSFLDFSNFEENSLGKEPNWAKEKRKYDQRKQLYITTRPWTSIDDSRLKKYLSEQKYSYFDLQKMLHRTAGAIQRRCCDLNIMDRPVKADNHIKWTDSEIDQLKRLILVGASYELMAYEINRSGKAIRGYCGRIYGTEDLDRIRKKLRSDE